MPGKYTLRKEEYKYLYSIIDMEMQGRWHEFYTTYGVEQSETNNWYCVQKEAHGGGTDSRASMSIDNDTGKGHCFTCNCRFNGPAFFKEYVAGTHMDQNEGSYTSFMIDHLRLTRFMKFKPNDDLTTDDTRNIEEMKNFYGQVSNAYKAKHKHEHINSPETKAEIKKQMTIPMEKLDKWVAKLLSNDDLLKFLKDSRNISQEVIEKYRIGEDDRGRIIFPIISADGSLLNVKAYQPWNQDYKWLYPFKGYITKPTPINNFTYNKMYFFEGEPDTYCAIGFGYNAVTMGSVANVDIEKMFGHDTCVQLFNGKEIVICLDVDEDGRRAANKLAESLYPYAKQIKIIDLDESEINPSPYGLDPKETKNVGGKEKRTETDFTDYMMKNGFNDMAKQRFDDIEQATIVYTENKDRVERETYKVTLREARQSRYYSHDGNIQLELTAAVSDMDCSSYKYFECMSTKCKYMGELASKKPKSCATCAITTMPDFGDTDEMIFHFLRDIPREQSRNPYYIKVSEHDILGMIQVTDTQKNTQQRALTGISPRCSLCMTADMKPRDLIHVNLVRDSAEAAGTQPSDNVGSAEIDMEAYMLGQDIYSNKTYKFKGIQTTAWNGQYAVLFISEAVPVMTTIESFKMNEDVHDVLSIFKQKEGESLADHFKRRYLVFSNASGITKRDELFFMCDLAYFSPLEIDNKKILPSIKRGWVEVLIGGDSRCGKSVVAEFLLSHYKMGELIGGSSSISRTGLLGGISYAMKNSSGRITWGKFPMNDGGLIIIDELSGIKEDILDDLTHLRSKGEATIEMTKSGKVPARVRKIMLSNPRTWSSENSETGTGIKFLKNICLKDQILSRFDIGFVVKSTDVNPEEFSSSYEQISTEFTEYQCQNLIKWAYSRSTQDVIFEDGFEEAVNNAQNEMLKKFHPVTLLVNQEQRAKLVRLSISLATMVYSTLDKDWNKIFVKVEHLDYITKKLTELYCHENMAMDLYSSLYRDAEELGDMKFMMNILKYVNIKLLMTYDEFSDSQLKNTFMDFISRVQQGYLYMPDGEDVDKSSPSYRMSSFDIAARLTGVLFARHCITRGRRGTHKKTKQFNNWLVERHKRMESGQDVEQSNILEPTSDESTSEVDKNILDLGDRVKTRQKQGS